MNFHQCKTDVLLWCAVIALWNPRAVTVAEGSMWLWAPHDATRLLMSLCGHVFSPPTHFLSYVSVSDPPVLRLLLIFSVGWPVFSVFTNKRADTHPAEAPSACITRVRRAVNVCLVCVRNAFAYRVTGSCRDVVLPQYTKVKRRWTFPISTNSLLKMLNVKLCSL